MGETVGYADLVADTEVELLHKKLDWLFAQQQRLTEAVNGLGQNIQWVIDNSKGIFEMFQSPQFMAALPSMMNPAAMQAAANTMESGEDG